MKRMLLIALLACPCPALAQVSVIAHASVPVEQIEKSRLLDFYTGDIKEWEDGTLVVVFDLKPKDLVKRTFYRFLGKTTSRMKSIWLKNMLSGEGNPPEALATEEDMVRKVAATPGAIGFVSRAKATAGVKVLHTITEESQ